MITVQSREQFLHELKQYLPEDCSGVEIGVLYGDFSKQILDIINPKHLILIDPFETGGESYGSGLSSAYSTEMDYENLLQRFKNEISSDQVIVRRKYSYEVVQRYPDNYIDIFYLDGSHLYEDVKRDLNDWFPKLKKYGLLAGHDYIQNNDFGVIQAVDEFQVEHNLEMIIFNENGGDWALKRKQP